MRKLRNSAKKSGFTLIEIIIVIAVISILSSMTLVTLFGAREKARDARRKSEIAQIGKFLTLSCYLPDGGAGEYDLILFTDEILEKYPQYGKFLSNIPKDPKSGTETESRYVYIVNESGKGCALYANLENANELATLDITVPTPGGGTGIFKADSPGWNGTPVYFQVSN